MDNISAISLANNPEKRRKLKHIGYRYHLIRKCVAEQQLCLEYVSTDEQVADNFTKKIGKPSFEKLRARLGVKDLTKDLKQ